MRFLLLALCAVCALVGCTGQASEDKPKAGKPAPLYDPALVGPGGQVFDQKCLPACHKRKDGEGFAMGPSIQTTLRTLPDRLATESYTAMIEQLRATRPDHYRASQAKFEAILGEPNIERRMALWLKAYLANPKFENPTSKMLPVAGLTAKDIEAAVAYVLSLR